MQRISILLFSTVFLFFSLPDWAQTASPFVDISYKKAIKLSKKTNKDIMLFFTIANNSFCNKLEKTLFSDMEVQKYYKSNFINLQILKNSKLGQQLVKEFNVNFFPSIVFVGADKQMIHKLSSLSKKTALISVGNTVLSSIGTLSYYNKMYHNEPDIFQQKPDFALDYAAVLEEAGEDYSSIINAYFSALQLQDFKKPETVDAIIKYSDNIYSPEFIYFARHIDLLRADKYSRKDKYKKLEISLSNHLNDFVSMHKKQNIMDTLLVLLDFLNITNKEAVISKVMLDYYANFKPQTKTYYAALKHYMDVNSDIISDKEIVNYCNEILKTHADQGLLNQALLWDERGIKEGETIELDYIRAALLYRLEREEEGDQQVDRIKAKFEVSNSPEWKEKLNKLFHKR